MESFRGQMKTLVSLSGCVDWFWYLLYAHDWTGSSYENKFSSFSSPEPLGIELIE